MRSPSLNAMGPESICNKRERERETRRDEIRQGETRRPSCKGELHYCPSQLALIAKRHIPQNENKKGNQKQFRFSLYAVRFSCQVSSAFGNCNNFWRYLNVLKLIEIWVRRRRDEWGMLNVVCNYGNYSHVPIWG